jgi:hypothetical protein
MEEVKFKPTSVVKSAPITASVVESIESSPEGWVEPKPVRRGGGAGTSESPDCSGPFGMSMKEFLNLHNTLTNKALKRLDEDGNTRRYFLGPLKSGDNVFVVDGQEKNPKTGKFKLGTSWTDKFFSENPVLGVTQDTSGYRHYKREHSLASLIINGRDLTISPEVQLDSLESYLPGQKCLKELVLSRFEEIISSTPSLCGKRKVEINEKLDHRMLAVTVTMCVTSNPRASLPILPGSKTPGKNLIEEIWAKARREAPTPVAAPTKAPIALSPQAPIASTPVAAPTPVALSDQQFMRLVEILGVEKAIEAYNGLRKLASPAHVA